MEDLPEPDTPAIPTIWWSGISTLTCFRLCTLAPRIWIAWGGHTSLFKGKHLTILSGNFTLHILQWNMFYLKIGALFSCLQFHIHCLYAHLTMAYKTGQELRSHHPSNVWSFQISIVFLRSFTSKNPEKAWSQHTRPTLLRHRENCFVAVPYGLCKISM